MQLEAGKLYKARTGHKVRIICRDLWSDDVYRPIYGEIIGESLARYTETGRIWCNEDHPYDIVAEWTEPEKVPLGPEDFPPGSVIRKPSEGRAWQMVIAVYEGTVEVPSGIFGFDELADLYEVKLPGEDWKPCWREAKQ